jgi:hypothetical protein
MATSNAGDRAVALPKPKLKLLMEATSCGTIVAAPLPPMAEVEFERRRVPCSWASQASSRPSPAAPLLAGELETDACGDAVQARTVIPPE